MRKFLLLILISSVLGILFYVYLYFSETGQFPKPERDFLYYSLSLLFATVAGFAVHFIDRQLDRWLSWRTVFFPRFLTDL